MTNIQRCLAQNMKKHRKRMGLSQAALAERAGTAANYIALIEVGKNFPSLPMLEKMALHGKLRDEGKRLKKRACEF